MQTGRDVRKEIEQALDDLDGLLKNRDVGAALTERGVNTSLALCISSGLRLYLQGGKRQAAEDLFTAAEEISARLASASADGGTEA
jgi:hypothetical protein